MGINLEDIRHMNAPHLNNYYITQCIIVRSELTERGNYD